MTKDIYYRWLRQNIKTEWNILLYCFSYNMACTLLNMKINNPNTNTIVRASGALDLKKKQKLVTIKNVEQKWRRLDTGVKPVYVVSKKKTTLPHEHSTPLPTVVTTARSWTSTMVSTKGAGDFMAYTRTLYLNSFFILFTTYILSQQFSG